MSENYFLCTYHQSVCKLGLKRMVNLLSGYPDASICGYPTDSDIIKLVLLAIYVTESRKTVPNHIFLFHYIHYSCMNSITFSA